jgi:hypothetical protein
VSVESLIIYIAGLILLTEVGLKRLINIAKLVKELHRTLRAEASPPPRFLNKSDSKRTLSSARDTSD